MRVHIWNLNEFKGRRHGGKRIYANNLIYLHVTIQCRSLYKQSVHSDDIHNNINKFTQSIVLKIQE